MTAFPSVPEADIVLHCCCGPCATACVERLLQEGRRPLLYFSNSNLNSREEYEVRLEQLRITAEYFKVPYAADEYRHDLWLEHCSALPDFQNAPERGPRCALCFRWSLGRTAEFAAAGGLPFTTSLTVSPHKPAKLIFEIGASLGNFQPYDFKKQNGFLRSTQLAKELQLYRQNYCGCEFSMR
jgi:predicted adenine nucleotide alpha hydrolase (AANH) superfamily ATPase